MVHICRICGKLFEDKTHNTAVCSSCRTAVCVICGKEFRKEYPFTQETCSPKCGGILRQQRGSNKGPKSIECNLHRICVICGKSFIAKSSRRKVCYDEHYHNCPICGTQVLTTGLHDQNRCCSKECRNILAGQSFKKKIQELGYSPCNTDEANEKRKATFTEHYGVDNVFKSTEFIESLPDILIAKYGTSNMNKVPEILKHKQETCLKKYGTLFPAQSKIVQAKIKSRFKSKYGDECYFKTDDYKKKSKQTSIANYGVENPMQCKEVHDRQVHARYSYIASDGTRLDSSYEVLVYEFCLKHNLDVKIDIPIHYTYEGKQHVTYIDFEIDGQLFECKGAHLLDGIYDWGPSMVPIEEKLKIYRQNHVVLITDSNARNLFGKPNSTESNGLKYQHKCPNPLIGVDIDLFNKLPAFPYREDRPRCFYDVRVDGKKSSHEAFYDANLRWKMIMNRIQYSGGFIDNNQILTAMNVTRICKQPSWFSKSLAKSIIQKYCTSDVIVDCFAGWGARVDAANELGRTYIGIDFNRELVDWHHQKGRDNIHFGDAHEFKYDGDCSVFICPPYSDPNTGRCFEDYNFEGFDSEAKGLSQCDWLKIVMENVPNAKEYVMVCKIVDDDFKQNIVATKANKSHFGINNEYIIVVRNK